MSQEAREMLASAVSGKDDAQILAELENFESHEQVLTMIFDGMKEALDPEKAVDAVIGWHITDPDHDHQYEVNIAGGSMTWQEKEPENARVTLKLALPDFLRMVAGELDGMKAFMGGKLKLTGDMMFAARIQGMFQL